MATNLLEMTDIEPALVVSSADEIAWADEADIIVVGFGGAGASAALQACELGGDVIAIDRFGGGGATAYSGGVYYASNTEPQRKAGIRDRADEMYKYMSAEGSSVSDETLRRFCENSSADFAWVSRYVPYSGKVYTGKASYPPAGKFLYYSGNEKRPEFTAVASPAPRGHRAVGKGFTGNVFYAGLSKAALDRGTRLITHAPARRLVTDSSGSVIGVEIDQINSGAIKEHERLYNLINPQSPFTRGKANKVIAECRAFERKNGSRRFIRARAGVVLSTGGFAYNLQMLSKFRPDVAQAHREVMRLGSLGTDGSGMALGQSVGGKLALMGNAFVGRSISPPESYLHGLLINLEGHRFINEDAYIGVVGAAIAAQSGNGTAWLIMDGRKFRQTTWDALTLGLDKFMFYGLPALMNILFGGTRRGRSLDDLARKCEIDSTNLRNTVDHYNANIASGRLDEFEKLPENIAPIGDGPYYALNMSLHNKACPALSCTLGGLQVDEATGQVVKENGECIPGLYAAGRTAVGICSAGYMSGLSLADLVFSGRRAASSIVKHKDQC